MFQPAERSIGPCILQPTYSQILYAVPHLFAFVEYGDTVCSMRPERCEEFAGAVRFRRRCEQLICRVFARPGVPTLASLVGSVRRPHSICICYYTNDRFTQVNGIRVSYLDVSRDRTESKPSAGSTDFYPLNRATCVHFIFKTLYRYMGRGEKGRKDFFLKNHCLNSHQKKKVEKQLNLWLDLFMHSYTLTSCIIKNPIIKKGLLCRIRMPALHEKKNHTTREIRRTRRCAG